jgi:hypothetical protein
MEYARRSCGQGLSPLDHLRAHHIWLRLFRRFSGHDSSSSSVLPNPYSLHKIFTPDRIRQKIGRIGKALLRHSLLSFGNSGAVNRRRTQMKFLRYAVLAGAIAIGGLSHGQSANKPSVEHESDRVRLIGAWHLVRMDAPEPDGQSVPVPQPKGMLIYTRDGHMSVQLMYPKTANSQSNEYVQDGYEASFGR